MPDRLIFHRLQYPEIVRNIKFIIFKFNSISNLISEFIEHTFKNENFTDVRLPVYEIVKHIQANPPTPKKKNSEISKKLQFQKKYFILFCMHVVSPLPPKKMQKKISKKRLYTYYIIHSYKKRGRGRSLLLYAIINK